MMSHWPRILQTLLRPPRVIVLREEPLSEAELNEALGVLPSHPLLRAVNQILETAERNAMIDAAQAAAQPKLCAAFATAANQLGLVRDDLERRRRLGRGEEK